MRPGLQSTHPLVIAWVAFAFLAVGASPAHFWLDSGEIAAAGAELGIMHPTGAPGYVPLLHLATAIPVGSLGFRMALCSSLCMAGAIGLLVAILARRDAHWALQWIVGLWLLLGLTLVRQGRVVEIYGFAALLLVATLWGFDPRVSESRRVSRRCLGVLAAVLATWSFGDLRLALVPPVVLAWVLGWRRGEPWTRWAPVFVAMGSLVVLTLPLSSARGPMADWGNPEDVGAVWAHVQAKLIRESFAAQLQGMGPRAWLLQARLVTTRLIEDVGPFGLLLAVAALGFGLTRPLSRAARARSDGQEDARARAFVDDDHRLLRWLGWIAGVELVYAVAINPMGGRDRQTGLALGLVVALAVGLGVREWLARPRAREQLLRWITLPLLSCLLWVPPAFESLADVRATRSWGPHDWTREALARTPRDALLLSQTDDLSAGLAAARTLEGARPDLVAMPAQHLYRAPSEWSERHPRHAAVWRSVARLPASADDRERVFAVFDGWTGPVALESPTTAVLAGVALPGAGEPPLWIAELPTPRDALPVGSGSSADRERDPIAEAIARFDGRLDNPVDRVHFASALGLWIKGRFARSPDSPLRWLEVERAYGMVLDRVDGDHVASLLGLAAARDRFGGTDEAIELTRRALELDPERATAHTNLALFLSRERSTLAEAREHAELAVELAAHRPNTWSRLRAVCQIQEDSACVQRATAALGG